MKVYVTGVRTSSITTRKYEGSNGSQAFTVDDGYEGYGIALHPIILGYAVAADAGVRFCDETGTEQWTADHEATVRAVAVDASGNVVIGGNRTSSITTRKYNAAGTEQWTADHGATVWAVAVDASGNVYTAGDVVAGPYTIRKYNSGGTEQWSADSGGTARGIAVDASGNVYVVGAGSGTNYIKKFDSSGAEVTAESWPVTTFNGLYAVAVDSQGEVYVAGDVYSSKTLWKYDATGATLRWSANHGARLNAVAVRPDVLIDVPALALPLALAAPYPLTFREIPALALPLALAAPTPTAPPLPPLGDGYRVYSAALTAQSELIPVGIDSIQARRRTNDSTWIVVTVTTPSAALLAVLDDALDTELLVIYAGTRTAAGAVDSGEMLRAVLTEYERERSQTGNPLKLTARMVPVPYTAETWDVAGMVERRMLDAGQRGVRLAGVHPRLRPGDTLVDGATSWTVGRVTYRIDPRAAWMEVFEDTD